MTSLLLKGLNQKKTSNSSRSTQVKVKQNDAFDVVKSGAECAAFMKPWPDEIDEEADEMNPQEGRDVGMKLRVEKSEQ